MRTHRCPHQTPITLFDYMANHVVTADTIACLLLVALNNRLPILSTRIFVFIDQYVIHLCYTLCINYKILAKRIIFVSQFYLNINFVKLFTDRQMQHSYFL